MHAFSPQPHLALLCARPLMHELNALYPTPHTMLRACVQMLALTASPASPYAFLTQPLQHMLSSINYNTRPTSATGAYRRAAATTTLPGRNREPATAAPLPARRLLDVTAAAALAMLACRAGLAAIAARQEAGPETEAAAQACTRAEVLARGSRTGCTRGRRAA